jgi:hypothetical protein
MYNSFIDGQPPFLTKDKIIAFGHRGLLLKFFYNGIGQHQVPRAVGPLTNHDNLQI